MLATLKKEDLINYFEDLFFSDAKTKRIDFCLTAKKHEADNQKYKKINSKSDMFKLLQRKEYTMAEYKKQNDYFDDQIKKTWIENPKKLEDKDNHANDEIKKEDLEESKSESYKRAKTHTVKNQHNILKNMSSEPIELD